MKPDEKELREAIIRTIKREKPDTVGHLVDAMVKAYGKDLSVPDVVRVINELSEKGKIEVSENPKAYASFGAYLLDLDVNLPLWMVVAATILMWITIYRLPSDFPWVLARWILGALFTLYLPGHAFIEALFTHPLSVRREIDEIERLALSIGMSLALLSFVGLLLNYTPWGIRLEPEIISLSVITLACTFIAAYRKYM